MSSSPIQLSLVFGNDYAASAIRMEGSGRGRGGGGRGRGGGSNGRGGNNNKSPNQKEQKEQTPTKSKPKESDNDVTEEVKEDLNQTPEEKTPSENVQSEQPNQQNDNQTPQKVQTPQKNQPQTPQKNQSQTPQKVQTPQKNQPQTPQKGLTQKNQPQTPQKVQTPQKNQPQTPQKTQTPQKGQTPQKTQPPQKVQNDQSPKDQTLKEEPTDAKADQVSSPEIENGSVEKNEDGKKYKEVNSKENQGGEVSDSVSKLIGSVNQVFQQTMDSINIDTLETLSPKEYKVELSEPIGNECTSGEQSFIEINGYLYLKVGPVSSNGSEQPQWLTQLQRFYQASKSGKSRLKKNKKDNNIGSTKIDDLDNVIEFTTTLIEPKPQTQNNNQTKIKRKK